MERSAISDMLVAARLHKPARAVYRAIFGAQGRARRRRLRELYAPLIKRGDLVFDVGANVGIYSEIFCALGAKVVACEPIPDCAKQLRVWLPGDKVTVVEAAVGSAAGKGQLHLANVRSGSSMSDAWVDVVKQSSALKGMEWIGDVEVQIVTVDLLSRQYGKPAYVKIDVEGFEESVLDGMPWQPDLLSFEFHKETMDAAFRCLAKPCVCRNSVCNFLLGDRGNFEFERWVTIDELQRTLSKLDHEHGFGDIFVRKA
jgi:FkbM family methyltransferase